MFMYAGNGDYFIHFVFPERTKDEEYNSGSSESRLKFIFGVCGDALLRVGAVRRRRQECDSSPPQWGVGELRGSRSRKNRFCRGMGLARVIILQSAGLCGPQPLPRFRPATHFTFACGPRRPRPDNNYVMLIMTTSQMIFFDSPPVRPKAASPRIFRRKFLFPQNIRTFAPLNSILFY